MCVLCDKNVVSEYLLLLLYFLYVRINGSNCRDVYNVANGTFEVGEVDRFVQPHLDWPNHFGFWTKALQQLVGAVG